MEHALQMLHAYGTMYRSLFLYAPVIPSCRQDANIIVQYKRVFPTTEPDGGSLVNSSSIVNFAHVYQLLASGSCDFIWQLLVGESLPRRLDHVHLVS